MHHHKHHHPAPTTSSRTHDGEAPRNLGTAAGQTSETTDVVLRAAVPFLSGESATEHLDGEFAYDPADPYAVTMKLEARCGSVTWTFARDLLAEGVYEPTGDGDVQVWPCLSNTGEAVVIVELCSPDGDGAAADRLARGAALRRPRPTTRCPPASESSHVEHRRPGRPAARAD